MYSPAIHVTGPDSFTFKVNDGSLDSAPAAVSITVSTPSISLALINTTLVSVGRSATLGVTLSAPAPAGGVTVTVTSDNTGILTVTAPGTVTISLGSTTGQVTVNGIAPGTVIVRGNAPGHTEGTLNVAVVEDTVGFPFRIPGAVTVETGGTGKLTVTLARPSTVNTTVTVRNSNPAVASVPGTVTVLAGQSMASIPVTAVGEGIATVTVIIGADGLATAVFVIPPFSGALTLLADTVGGVTGGPPLAIPVGLQVSPTPLPTVVLSSGTTRTVTVPLSRPAPPGGLSVTVTLSNPAIASVPATIDIAAGQQTATFAVMALASGEALITLTAGTEVIQISLLVDRTLSLTGRGLAAPVGVLVAPVEATLALPVGVQVSPTLLPTVELSRGATRTVTVPLSRPAPPGGLSVTVTISNPAIASGPATIDVAAGQQTVALMVSGLASGEALITLTAGTEVIQISLLVDRTLGLTGGGLATSVGVLVAPTEAPLAPAVGVQVR